MIHYAHGVTCGPSCIAYDNTITTDDIVVTDLTFNWRHVTCANCIVDVDEAGNVTDEAARAQAATDYNPIGFSHIPINPYVIFTKSTNIYTVIVCPTDTGDSPQRDTPDQAGFAMEGFGHFNSAMAIIHAENQARINGFVVVYPLVALPRHLRAYRPIAYRDRSTWYRVV